nr:hypothetical protein K-LCC10_0343 [Kaumoebavirus]
MNSTIWRAVVLDVIYNNYGSNLFTRKGLMEHMNEIKSETNSVGKTPAQTMSRILQHLRDEGFINFGEKRGTYVLKEYEKISAKGPSKGEKMVERILEKLEVGYETQQRFADMKDKGLLSLDFYIIGLYAAIEFDGAQHYQSVDFFGGEEALRRTIQRDKKKSRYCKRKGIALLRLDKLDAKDAERRIIEFLENLEEDAMYRGIGELLA